MRLRQIENERAEAIGTSAAAPKSFAEGVVNYVIRRRAQLVAEFEDTDSTFQVERTANKIAALDKILKACDASMPTREWKRTPPAGKSGPDHKIHLARVMTPPKWEEQILPKFGVIDDQAIADLIGKKLIEENMAIHSEVSRFIRYLHNVAREGEGALPRKVA